MGLEVALLRRRWRGGPFLLDRLALPMLTTIFSSLGTLHGFGVAELLDAPDISSGTAVGRGLVLISVAKRPAPRS